eukprot:TRINITY_DN27013_c0_g1_i1.p1 TRINITY_DN27013_c0_g1~~TRINITY_DN27013_c0_g1_i1.p1  ORF type:complete len:213 (-),score=33.93 TRINITY_DN27013_c0_g1_i1:81-719(-)
MYYAATILSMSDQAAGVACMQEAAGAGSTASDPSDEVKDICLTAAVALAQLVGCGAGMFLVDSYGRKPLMLVSLIGVGGSLGLLGFTFHASSSSALGPSAPVWAMASYLLFFGVGLGPLPWVLNAEIYPLYARSTCIAIATATNWIANFLVASTFLDMATALSTDSSCPQAHPDGAFWSYAMVAAVGFAALTLWMPETSGLSLEDISKLFEE